MDSNDQNKSKLTATAEDLEKALPRLSAQQIAEISPKLRPESYPPGEILIRQDQPANRFFILVGGKVEVWHTDQTGRSIKVNSLGPGDYFGETGLIQNQPRNASVIASDNEPVEVLVMDRADFEAMMQDSKATEMHMAQEMVQRLIKLACAQDRN